MLICPRCGGKNFWRLATGQRRCGQCGLTRKFDRTYWNSTKMSPYWKGRLLEYFCLGVPAYRLRFQVPLDLKTVQRWFRILRIAIYRHEMKEMKALLAKAERRVGACRGQGPDSGRTSRCRPAAWPWGSTRETGRVITLPSPGCLTGDETAEKIDRGRAAPLL